VKIKSLITVGTLFSVVLLTLVACGPKPGALPGASEPTMTAILLPTWTPSDRSEPVSKGTRHVVGHDSEQQATQAAGSGSFQTAAVDGGEQGSHNLRYITDGVDPVWSPDGEQIAFTRWREPRGVWVINSDGTGERRVFDWDEARWPSWSPDGEQILFSRQHGGLLEEKERCVGPPPGVKGKRHCFTIPVRPHWRLGIVDIDEGSFVEPPSPDIAQAPGWSPNGDKIVYDGEQGLWIQTLDGDNSYALTDEARDTAPVWSPDGERIAFVRYQHDHWEICTVDVDGGDVTWLTDTPERPDGTPGSSVSPAWSPDGEHLAFLTDRRGEWQIWVMKADGSGQKPLFESALDGLALEYSSIAERAISWTQ
jgi:dipeptidyl aminopeptidase/acylaminoacyl peptidase